MPDLPPEIRQALITLLLEALKELVALLRHLAEHIIGGNPEIQSGSSPKR